MTRQTQPEPCAPEHVTFELNGDVISQWVSPATTLLDILRARADHLCPGRLPYRPVRGLHGVVERSGGSRVSGDGLAGLGMHGGNG